MAITVQKITAPNIVITGTRVTKAGDSLTDVGTASTYTTAAVVSQSVGKTFVNGSYVDESGHQYTSNEPLIFVNSVEVDFTSVYNLKTTTEAANFGGSIPANWEVGEIQDNVYVVGETDNDSPSDAGLAEIRYTINGKDPSQTRSRRYYGTSATLNSNLSGGDNLVLKVRIYRNGEWSNVKEAVLRIITPSNISVAGQTIP